MSRYQQRTHFYQAVLFSFECLNLSYANGVSSMADASASVMHVVFTELQLLDGLQPLGPGRWGLLRLGELDTMRTEGG